MSRPLMQHQIGLLESMFAESPADLSTLTQLAQELQHRTTPRAAVLLARVEKALSSVGKKVRSAAEAPGPRSNSPESPTLAPLWEVRSKAKPDTPTDAAPNEPVRAPNASRESPTTTPTLQESTPKMPLAEAFKLLKCPPEASWPTIEQSRRRLVSESNPLRTAGTSPEKLDQILAHARLVNAAYHNVWQARQEMGK